MARREAPRIPDALMDQLLASANPKTAFDTNGLLDDLKKALASRRLFRVLVRCLPRGRPLSGAMNLRRPLADRCPGSRA